jgi:hypothetical protein
MLTVPLQINGKDVHTSKLIDVTNPSTSKVIHQASGASVSDALQAVEAAEAAFESWADLPPDQNATSTSAQPTSSSGVPKKSGNGKRKKQELPLSTLRALMSRAP